MFRKLRKWHFHEAKFKVLSGFYAIGTTGINCKMVTLFFLARLWFCAQPKCLILSKMLEAICLVQLRVSAFVHITL